MITTALKNLPQNSMKLFQPDGQIVNTTCQLSIVSRQL